MLDPEIRVNADRFWATVERSAEIGRTDDGSLTRLTLTEADKVMRDEFVRWCRDAELQVSIDQIGNIFGRRAGHEDGLPPVLIGSHLDTQENGGRFDGIIGVLAALEVVRTLNDVGHVTRRPLEIVNWTNEEGSRFAPPMLASACFAGVHQLDWAYGRISQEGVTLGDALDQIGYRGDAPVGKRQLDSYFELHIEQGPILDAEGIPIGAVTHGYYSHRIVVEFVGETAHTGTWPMEKRRNALVAAARLLSAVDDIGWAFAGSGGKATAAQLLARPNKPGVITSWSQVVCSVSHEDQGTEGTMFERMSRAVDEAATRANCEARIIDTWTWGGAIFDSGLIATIQHSANRLGYSYRDLPSQAAHDAYFLARVCPTAMIFTPCRDGITHNGAEYTTKAETAPGVNVLLHSAVARANA